MVGIDFWHAVEAAYFFLLVFVSLPAVEIARRAGISSHWRLLFFVPGVNIFSYWLVAYLPWPALAHRGEALPPDAPDTPAANPPYNPNLLPPIGNLATTEQANPPYNPNLPIDTSSRLASVKGRISYVIGPDGSPLTEADLPSPRTRRWSLRRKADIVSAINGGLVSRQDATARYGLSEEKLTDWMREVEEAGLLGPRATRVKKYRA